MEGDDFSTAKYAAVSSASEAADTYAEVETASLAPSPGEFTSGAENVPSQFSDGYPPDEAEEFSYSSPELVAGSGVVFEYYEEESGEFLSMATIPAPTVAAGDGFETSLPPQKQGQAGAINSTGVAIDQSTPVSAGKFASQTSSLAPQSLCSPVSSIPGKDEDYSGMPKLDADISVGKKIVRRRKLSIACPPSSFHADVQPPGLELVQRALRHHKAAGIRAFKRLQPRLSAIEFHNEKGQMLLHGCLEGKYVGDVLGGLPHGHGQHWTPAVGSSGALDCRRLLYEGAWEYGCKIGYGRMLYHNGQEYRGNFKNGERHGRGAIHFLDGTVYDGEWFKGRRHGLGTSYYKDGGFYKGAWSKDNRDGWGAYYWPSTSRKYEGEWVGDDPVCGNHMRILDSEYAALKELVPSWCHTMENLPSALSKEKLQIPLMELRNPESAYYPHTCGKRQQRIDIKRAALKDPPDPKIVVELKGSLSPQQMQGLRLAFDKLSPGYYRRSIVNRVQIRRLILLARLDPDSEMGKRLFVNFQEAAIETVGLTYNNFMKVILSFHHPREAAPYKSAA